MKVQTPRAIQVQDIEGAPPWMERFLGPLNSAIEQLNAPLQKSLSHKDNLNSEPRALKVEHETAFQVTLQTLRGMPSRVTVSKVGTSTPVTAALWWRVSSGNNRVIDLCVSFTPAQTDEVLLGLLFEGD